MTLRCRHESVERNGSAFFRRALPVLLLTLPSTAFAHALLVRSEPAQRATLHAAPPAVRLWFSERLEPAFSSMEVLTARGERVTQAHAAVPANDGKLLELPLPPLSPGDYTVQYRVLSVDGHAVKGGYAFRVRESRTPR